MRFTTWQRRWNVYPVALIMLLLAAPTSYAQKEKSSLNLHEIPKKVMNGLRAKFPKAEIHEWTKEKEDGLVIYDIEFMQEGKKFEADIKEDGTIHNWERQVAAKDLPDPVTKAVQKKYPKSTMKEVMAVTSTADGKDVLEGYEIVLEIARKKGVEVTVAPNGKILEDSGEKK
jgi:hypothetical protein